MPKLEILTCRRVLDIMMITGFMCHHMLRINISIAIVDMVANPNTTTTTNTTLCRLSLTQYQKNNILGIFFISYGLMLTPAGRLAEIFGTRRVLGINMVLASLLTIFTPIYCNYYYWLVSRCLLGVLIAVTWPGALTVASKWVEPQATASFTSHMIASSLGSAITLSMCGFLIAKWNWPSVFYVSGSISMIWTLFWWYLVYDTPAQHPRISNNEKLALEQKMGVVSVKPKVGGVPWMEIAKSRPVWALSTVYYTSMFSLFVIFNQQPYYLKSVLGFNIKQNGLLSGLPFFSRYLFAVLTSLLVDHLMKNKTFTTTNIRKFLVVSGQLATVLLSLMQIIWGYNSTISIFYFTAMLAVLGYSGVGLFPNSLDLSPNFAGTVFGLTNVIGITSGYVGTVTVTYLVHDAKNFYDWQKVFGVLAVVNLVGAMVFFIWGSGEIQKWNEPRKIKENAEEMALQT